MNRDFFLELKSIERSVDFSSSTLEGRSAPLIEKIEKLNHNRIRYLSSLWSGSLGEGGTYAFEHITLMNSKMISWAMLSCSMISCSRLYKNI